MLLAHCYCKKCISICICGCRGIVSSVSAPIKKKIMMILTGRGILVLIGIRNLNCSLPSQVLDPLSCQRRGERVQDHLSAHARAQPIVAHITPTCLFRREIQKLARKLFQHAAGKNVGERSYDAEKTCQTEFRELLSPWNYHSDKYKSSYFQSRREN